MIGCSARMQRQNLNMPRRAILAPARCTRSGRVPVVSAQVFIGVPLRRPSGRLVTDHVTVVPEPLHDWPDGDRAPGVPSSVLEVGPMPDPTRSHPERLNSGRTDVDARHRLAG